MTSLRLLFCAAVLGLAGACAGTPAEVQEPTITYDYDDDDDYEEVAEKADDYCEDTYDKDAYLIDQDSEGGDYEATFACR